MASILTRNIEQIVENEVFFLLSKEFFRFMNTNLQKDLYFLREK